MSTIQWEIFTGGGFYKSDKNNSQNLFSRFRPLCTCLCDTQQRFAGSFSRAVLTYGKAKILPTAKFPDIQYLQKNSFHAKDKLCNIVNFDLRGFKDTCCPVGRGVPPVAAPAYPRHLQAPLPPQTQRGPSPR